MGVATEEETKLDGNRYVVKEKNCGDGKLL